MSDFRNILLEMLLVLTRRQIHSLIDCIVTNQTSNEIMNLESEVEHNSFPVYLTKDLDKYAERIKDWDLTFVKSSKMII